ncbi:Hypothetical predicted protein [Cloeon dipterum]|uniref:Sm domain-containing protein n=1 Tax=Cloeon dipterum TaxID=197152 RepID=A0A8S1E3B9_9INSE|nr:Hypothetical predicted protein [Cloeon dipterum]
MSGLSQWRCAATPLFYLVQKGRLTRRGTSGDFRDFIISDTPYFACFETMKMDGILEHASENSQPEFEGKDTPGRAKLRSWLNRMLKIEMTDGRILVGSFLCTDRDANVILGNCCEYLGGDEQTAQEDSRMLGLVMVPGRHIVSVQLDEMPKPQNQFFCSKEEIV